MSSTRQSRRTSGATRRDIDQEHASQALRRLAKPSKEGGKA